jgi:SAM-dependent methyltransferase
MPNLLVRTSIRTAKEIARHVALRLGATELLDRRARRLGYKTNHLSAPTLEARFSSIYESGAWLIGKDQHSRSGEGSDDRATMALRAEFGEVLRGLECRKLLDVGCGDWHWMRQVDLPCEYVGVDIVPSVIASNKAFERPGVSFAVANAVTDPLPAADVILCREMLFHLSYADGLAAIANMRRSARWLIATTDYIWFNSDIRTGDYRPLDLRRPPYDFPAPALVIPDDGVLPRRTLGVWRTEELRPRIRH